MPICVISPTVKNIYRKKYKILAHINKLKNKIKIYCYNIQMKSILFLIIFNHVIFKGFLKVEIEQHNSSSKHSPFHNFTPKTETHLDVLHLFLISIFQK